MAWDVLSGAAKMAWDVLSGVTKTAWDVLSGVTKHAVCFVQGVKKWHGMFCPGMFCPTFVCKIIHSLKLVDYLHVQAGNPWYNYYLTHVYHI